jgi:hypothetical protein
MSADAVSLTEHHHLAEMHENLRRKLQEAQRTDAGRINSIRADVLAMVVAENYDKAKDTLQGYVEGKNDFPGFQNRAIRYVHHCCDLIQAINTKRNFPGLAALSLAKQQEIHEKVLSHFEELKANLKQIEKVERETRLTDMRSTVWVVKSFSTAVIGITLTALFVDIRSGFFSSVFYVCDKMMDDASTWVVNLIHW